MNERKARVNELKPSRWLYLLTAGVLFLGTVLVVMSTRDPDTVTRASRRRNNLSVTCPPLAATPGLATRGAALQRLECSGCHAGNRREIGPSYAVIAARYHCRPAELLTAIGHPEPGWADYPPGPSGPPLASADRAALVYWILNFGAKGDE